MSNLEKELARQYTPDLSDYVRDIRDVRDAIKEAVTEALNRAIDIAQECETGQGAADAIGRL